MKRTLLLFVFLSNSFIGGMQLQSYGQLSYTNQTANNDCCSNYSNSSINILSQITWQDQTAQDIAHYAEQLQNSGYSSEEAWEIAAKKYRRWQGPEQSKMSEKNESISKFTELKDDPKDEIGMEEEQEFDNQEVYKNNKSSYKKINLFNDKDGDNYKTSLIKSFEQREKDLIETLLWAYDYIIQSKILSSRNHEHTLKEVQKLMIERKQKIQKIREETIELKNNIPFSKNFPKKFLRFF